MALQDKVHWVRSLRTAKHQVAKLLLSLEEAQGQSREVQLLSSLHNTSSLASYIMCSLLPLSCSTSLIPALSTSRQVM